MRGVYVSSKFEKKLLKITFMVLLSSVTFLVLGLSVLITGYAAHMWFPVNSVYVNSDDLNQQEYVYSTNFYDDISPDYFYDLFNLYYENTEPTVEVFRIAEPYDSAAAEAVLTDAVYEPRKPMVAITFDDGPSHLTPSIVDLLYEHNSVATFFVLGYRVERYPEIVAHAANNGNQIANHAWSHARISQSSAEVIRDEIVRTSEIITYVVGHSPPVLRPPFGRSGGHFRPVAEELGYAIVNWTIDPLDWRYRDSDRIYNLIMNQVEDGSVILLHDIHATTAEAMNRVIPRLIEEGFQLVTVTEVLEYFYGELIPGKVYGKVFDVE